MYFLAAPFCFVATGGRCRRACDGSFTYPELAPSCKAKQKLGWTLRVRFPELVEIMMKADIEAIGAQ